MWLTSAQPLFFSNTGVELHSSADAHTLPPRQNRAEEQEDIRWRTRTAVYLRSHWADHALEGPKAAAGPKPVLERFPTSTSCTHPTTAFVFFVVANLCAQFLLNVLSQTANQTKNQSINQSKNRTKVNSMIKQKKTKTKTPRTTKTTETIKKQEKQ